MMLNKTRRGWPLVLLALAGVGLFATTVSVQAQFYRPYRDADQGSLDSRPSRPPARPFDDPDRAADAAREATGGRVLGVQGDQRDGRAGYRVRVLEPGGRVRNFHYDPANGPGRD